MAKKEKAKKANKKATKKPVKEKSPLKGLPTRAKKSNFGNKPSKSRRIAAITGGVDDAYGPATGTYEIQQNKGRKSKKPIKHKDQHLTRSPQQMAANRKYRYETKDPHHRKTHKTSLRQAGDVSMRQQIKNRDTVKKNKSKPSMRAKSKNPRVRAMQSMIGWLKKGMRG